MLADAPLLAIIPVADMARAKRFYRDTLGLTLTRESGPDVSFTSGGHEFGLYETPHGGQAQHTLASWKVADLDAEMTELRSKGVVFEEYDLPGLKTLDGVAEADGMRAAWFKDSEGNILCVNEVREA
ncbi:MULTISPECIES: VOC family protein [Kitasatospora]|uniref:Catechol 2,3-dioxygenase-like lactoylglutathione lyase family enzyme n=2 Tax=Kitasatospora TaxID=2063 RepID=A0ABT1IYJ8_9ACTN|nr:VOC family protein [Kitasatospora paracochleata]MCP2310227.1 catechol 2,3-dioxygenase-like lactoylglutathione lyase family enzyme [Kitasatospora paracochleata]